MGGGYKAKPQGLDGLVTKFKSLEDGLAAVRKMVVGLGIQVDPVRSALVVAGDRGIALDDGGNVLINDGGTLVVRDADGNEIGQLGTLSNGHVGLAMFRSDATASLVVDDTSGGFVGLYDKAGNIVLSDDATSGVGIATPYLTAGVLTNTNTATWPATAETTWTTIASAYVTRQNPQLAWVVALSAPAGLTGQFQLLLGGTPIGTVQTVTGATTAYWEGVQPWPSSTLFGTDVYLELQAQVTAGTGSAHFEDVPAASDRRHPLTCSPIRSAPTGTRPRGKSFA